MKNLEKLANLVGISSEYIDKIGKTHYTTDFVRQFFLKEMGYNCQTESEIEQEITKLENEIWLNGLDSVYTFFTNETEKKVQIYLPKIIQSITYTLTSETGEHSTNTLQLASLKIIEEKTIDNKTYAKYELDIISNLAIGYHTLQVEYNKTIAKARIIIAPQKCYLKDGIKEETFKTFGLAIQLYALRSQKNMGIGDFGDLKTLIPLIAKNGGDILGLNPLSALFAQNKQDVSPYRGLTRAYLNYAYIDLPAIEEFQTSAEVAEFMKNPQVVLDIRRLREINLVDYYGVLRLKLIILKMMYTEFKKNNSPRKQIFENWKQQKGTKLYNTCLFEALLEKNSSNDYAKDWRFWADNNDNINSEETKEFAKTQAERIDFYAYCHWLADTQLAEISNLCQQLGMKIGLYLDMPIGAASSGAETWFERHIYAEDIGVGAPADPMRPRGQSWGFSPYHPQHIRKAHYQPFIDLIRENMSHAQALRIDHAMGLLRLFWIYFAPGNPIAQGAYIYYNMKETVAILCLESHRHQCLVIGEDLGTVPAGFREYMYEHGLLSNKVFFRQKTKDGEFLPPHDYQYLSLAQASTHDQATAIGFWLNEDIEDFNKCGLYINREQYINSLQARDKERKELIKAFEKEQTFSSPEAHNDAIQKLDGKDAPIQLEEAVNKYASRTNSCLFLHRIEDIYRQKEMENVPGTVYEYPNWRVKLPIDVEDMEKDGRFSHALTLTKKERK